MLGKTVLNGWTVESLIGQGSFGSVYKIHKEEYGVDSYSALKVISVPQSDSDLRAIMNEGMDEMSVTSYFEGVVNDIVREISIMSQLKGHPNIVGCEDHQVIAKADTVGWDILIKMELLSSLVDYQLKEGFTIENIVTMGTELTDALTLCHSKGLVHRDIKPDNIFVNEYGVYKLGDFGVARNVENAMSVKSKKGTEVYMAPEVYMGKAYDATVDLYSLGIVLYKCLNNNRLPFLPAAGQPIKPGDREAALIKRMEGTPIPRPVHGDDELARIVLKSIAFAPSERYQTAKEMLDDLKHYAAVNQGKLDKMILAPASGKIAGTSSTASSQTGMSKSQNVEPVYSVNQAAAPVVPVAPAASSDDLEKTVGVQHAPLGYMQPAAPVQPVAPVQQVAPAAPVQPVAPVQQVAPAAPVQPVNSVPQPTPVASVKDNNNKKEKKKSKLVPIIASVAAVAVLAGGGFALSKSGVFSSSDKTVETTASKTKEKKPTKTPTPKPTTTNTPTPKPTNTPTPKPTNTPTPQPTSSPTTSESGDGFLLTTMGGWSNVNQTDDGTYLILTNYRLTRDNATWDYGYYFDYSANGNFLEPSLPKVLSFDSWYVYSTYYTNTDDYLQVYAYMNNDGNYNEVILDVYVSDYYCYIDGYYECDSNWNKTSDYLFLNGNEELTLAVCISYDGGNSFDWYYQGDYVFNSSSVDIKMNTLNPNNTSTVIEGRYRVIDLSYYYYDSDWFELK